jgi:cytochrome b561
MFKRFLHWVIFIAVILQLIGLLTGQATMPE